MYAEAYLHDLISKVAPIDGLTRIEQADLPAWPNSLAFETKDGKIFVLHFSSGPTDEHVRSVKEKIGSFDYLSAEDALEQINELETSVTTRMLQDAISNDPYTNPKWCGGAGGTAAQHIAWLNQQKATLRATLPR